MSSHGGGCSHHDHGSDGHVCGSLPGTGVTQTMDEMRYQRGVWGAVMDGNIDKLKAELPKRPNEVNETDPSGYSPLHYAARSGNLAIVAALLAAGANPNAQTSGLQATPLQRAAYMGHSSVIKALVKAGAALNTQDSDGNTALHKAVMQGRESAIETLVALEADKSVVNVKGLTAREVAQDDRIANLVVC